MDKILGVMLDCSRNAVMKPDTVKLYASIIKKMGYNTLMLYTEDTYEVDNQPFFGHLRGRYSKEELKDIDSYCASIGIELVPCIQTLAHLGNLFKWQEDYDVINDCDDILLIGEEKTYKFIEDMIYTLSQCFSSHKIHIGMDEAIRVGTGKYQQKNGIKDRFDIINEHLHKVCEIAEKYGLEPMIWSDMFCRLALKTEDQYLDTDTSKILDKAALPEKISLVYWDYYSDDYNRYARMIKTNKLFGRKVYFAGGAWTWKGFAPDNAFSMKNTTAALKACNDCGIDGVFFTVWGDDGAECSAFAVLPALLYAAELAKGNDNLDSVKEKFKKITGCDFDSFMLFDKLDISGGNHLENPSKYLLYNDPFMGIRDYCCSLDDREYYEKLANEISEVSEKGSFAYLFDVYEKLAEVLAIKGTIGIRIREAYLKKDMAALKEIVNDCDILLQKLKLFHAAHQNRWFLENKPHGFDVQDIRLGGIIQRIKSCRNRLAQFADGESDCILELEEPMLNKANGKSHWHRVATPNLLAY